MAVRVRPMQDLDARAVLEIYQAGIDEGDATFETQVPSWADFDAAKLSAHRFVAVDPDSDEVLGWIAAAAVSTRVAYTGVVEHSVFVRPSARRRGVASVLLGMFVGSTERAGIWTIQANIFPANRASVVLHTGQGFRVVGLRERLGQHHGVWRDVLLLERRRKS
jgi:L-amino acid N-acyltransferase YncA